MSEHLDDPDDVTLGSADHSAASKGRRAAVQTAPLALRRR